MSKPAEAQVERYLKKEIEKLGGYCWKFVSPGAAGVPDRIILLPGGRVVFAELKAPGQKPKKIQVKIQDGIREMGLPVFGCVDSYAAADEVVEFCKEVLGYGCSNMEN